MPVLNDHQEGILASWVDQRGRVDAEIAAWLAEAMAQSNQGLDHRYFKLLYKMQRYARRLVERQYTPIAAVVVLRNWLKQKKLTA